MTFELVPSRATFGLNLPPISLLPWKFCLLRLLEHLDWIRCLQRLNCDDLFQLVVLHVDPFRWNSDGGKPWFGMAQCDDDKKDYKQSSIPKIRYESGKPLNYIFKPSNKGHNTMWGINLLDCVMLPIVELV